MKIEKIIFTVLVVCMVYSGIRAMKKRGYEDDKQSPTFTDITQFVQDFLGEGDDNRLVQIITDKVKSCFNLSAPPDIINAINVLLRSRDVNNRFNCLLTFQVIQHILINAGVDVNATINNPGHWNHGMTALHLAAGNGNINVVKALLEVFSCLKGRADFTNERDINGKTALHLAAYAGHANVIDALIDGGADVYIRDNHGCTALHVAAYKGRVDVIQSFLVVVPDDQRAAFVNAIINDPRCKRYYGWTALHLATYKNCTCAMRILIAAGANVNAVINNPRNWGHNMTALHLAVHCKKVEAVKVFIDVGVKIPENLLSYLFELGVNVSNDQVIRSRNVLPFW